jgi:hypothetical protein
LSCGESPNLVCKGFGRRLQGHRLVDRVPAFVVRTRENKVSLRGVGGHCVATPLQRDVLLWEELGNTSCVSLHRGYFYPLLTCVVA